jgi:tetratricopeptide (TPR) repeat protein
VALVEKYIGSYFADVGDQQSAGEHFERALTLDTERLDTTPANRMAQFDVAIDLGGIADAEWVQGQTNEAAVHYERSLAMRERLAASDPADVLNRSRVAYGHLRLARFYLDLDRRADALEHARQAVAISRTIAGIDDVNAVLHAQNLAVLGRAAASLGRATEACAGYRDALALARHVQPHMTHTPVRAAELARTIEQSQAGLRACRSR